MTQLFAFLLFLCPWFVNLSVYDWCRTPKEFFCEIVIAVMVVWCVVRRKVSLSGLNLPLAALFVWLIFGLYYAGFLIVPFAPYVVDSSQATTTDIINWEYFVNTNAVNVVLFAFLYCIIQSEIKPSTICKAIMVSTFLLSVHGIIQHWEWCHGFGGPGHPWRTSGFFGNPNNYNEHLAVALPFFLLMKHRWKWVCITLCIIAISLARFWTSYSLGAGFVALPIAGLFYLWMIKSRWLRYYIWVSLLLIIVLYPIYKEPTFQSLIMRQEFIEITVNKYNEIAANRSIGWGFGMYKQVVGKVQYEHGSLGAAHNDFLQAFVEFGKIGMVLLLIIIGDIIRKVWLHRLNKKIIVYATVLLVAAQISMVSFLCHIAPTMLYIFTAYALLQRECRNAVTKVRV